MRTRFPKWAMATVALLWLALAPPSSAGDAPRLAGEWRPAAVADAPWTAFDPSQLSLISRQPDGALVRLWLEGEGTPRADWLEVRNPGMERVTWLRPDGGEVRAHLLQTGRPDWMGHGRIGFELDRTPTAANPVQLRLEAQDGVNGRLAFRLAERQTLVVADARWVGLVGTCLSVLAGMAMIALVFGARLREATFFLYAGYLLSYALIQALQTGYAGSPLGWSWLAGNPRLWGRIAVMGSIVFAVLFLVRFADLRQFLPRSVRPLQAYAVTVLVAGTLAVFPLTRPLASALVNPLIIIGGPLLLVVAAMAWRRGSRYAGFFVVGWTPLLLATVAGSLQLYGAWPRWFSATETALMAAAFEALVLSAGLADRTASVRRARDEALTLASRDPLTGAVNRRALQQRLDSLLAEPRKGPGLAVLFADLDHFKRLNDRLGHAEGDRALRLVAGAIDGMLREGDTLARFGGEEFVVLLPQCELGEAGRIAERIRRRVEGLGPDQGFAEVTLTISIGVAAARPDDSSQALLERADKAMYAAKAAGRNRIAMEAG